MNDYFRFVNSQGETVNFGSIGLIIDENDLRDFAWGYTSQYGNIVDFKRGIVKKKIRAKAYGDNLVRLKNQLFEKLEKDVLAKKKGRVYIGEYYLGGYFISSKKKDYTINGLTEYTLEFVTDESYWKKETTFNYRINGDYGKARGLDYPYDYAYDYTSPANAGYINNVSFVPSNFIMKIYGPAENPLIIIGDNQYKVNVNVLPNEYLTIDSLNKKVYKTNARGNVVNAFKDRDLATGYIFEKIPVGENYLYVSPTTNVDVILIEERSEPQWI